MRFGLLLLVSLPLAAAADWSSVFDSPVDLEDQSEAFRAVQQSLSLSGSLTGHFRQSKQLKVLMRPLSSEGQFLLMDLGFLWLVERPVKVEYLVTEGKLLEKRLGEVTSSRMPSIQSYGASIEHLFRGQVAQLDADFEIYFEGNTNSWTIGLKPIGKSKFEAFVRLITLRGASSVDWISILETSGNVTEIQFTDVVRIPGEPPAKLRSAYTDFYPTADE